MYGEALCTGLLSDDQKQIEFSVDSAEGRRLTGAESAVDLAI